MTVTTRRGSYREGIDVKRAGDLLGSNRPRGAKADLIKRDEGDEKRRQKEKAS